MLLEYLPFYNCVCFSALWKKAKKLKNRILTEVNPNCLAPVVVAENQKGQT